MGEEKVGGTFSFRYLFVPRERLEKTPLLVQEGCPKGGVVTEGVYRITYLPVDREGLLLFFWFN